MIHLNGDFYNELAQELVTLIYDKEKNDGVIEIKVNNVDVIFAFNAANYTIERGLESINYLIIALDGDVRCSTDFSEDMLNDIIEL